MTERSIWCLQSGMFIVSTSWQTKSINIQQRDKGHLSFPWAAHIQVFSFMTLKGYWLAGIVFACGSSRTPTQYQLWARTLVATVKQISTSTPDLSRLPKKAGTPFGWKTEGNVPERRRSPTPKSAAQSVSSPLLSSFNFYHCGFVKMRVRITAIGILTN